MLQILKGSRPYRQPGHLGHRHKKEHSVPSIATKRDPDTKWPHRPIAAEGEHRGHLSLQNYLDDCKDHEHGATTERLTTVFFLRQQD